MHLRSDAISACTIHGPKCTTAEWAPNDCTSVHSVLTRYIGGIAQPVRTCRGNRRRGIWRRAPAVLQVHRMNRACGEIAHNHQGFNAKKPRNQERITRAQMIGDTPLGATAWHNGACRNRCSPSVSLLSVGQCASPGQCASVYHLRAQM